MRAVMRRPAAACRYTPQAAAVGGGVPCASSPVMTPLRTSPVPPVARPGLGKGAMRVGWPGAAMTVWAPFSISVTPHRLAHSRATAMGSDWISATGKPVRVDISPGWGVSSIGRRIWAGQFSMADRLFSPSASIRMGILGSMSWASVNSSCRRNAAVAGDRPMPQPIRAAVNRRSDWRMTSAADGAMRPDWSSGKGKWMASAPLAAAMG